MSLRRYLREHRGEFIDHRVPPPPPPRPSLEDMFDDSSREPVEGGGRRRRTGSRSLRSSSRFKHLRPAFAPSAFSDPLPYEEPWQRAFR